MFGDPTLDALKRFRRDHGYFPRVISTKQGVFGVGVSHKTAVDALELARDGVLILQLSEAFGGIRYMTRKACEFIDNWEVEAYRRSVAAGSGA